MLRAATPLPALSLAATLCVAAPAAPSHLKAQLSSPGGRSCASTTWSPTYQMVVMFGGSTIACGVEPMADGALWGWNGTTWRRLALTDGPGPREDAHLLHVGPAGELMLVGGRRQGVVHADAWRFDTAWGTVTTTGTGPGRLEHAAAAFDPRRREVVRFGGGVSGAPGQLSRQTALLRDGTWSVITDAFGPAARVGHGMTWSPRDSSVLMYGGFAAAGSFRDLWQWTGLQWRRLDSLGPAHIEGPALVATDRGLVLLGAGLDAQPGQPLRAWMRRDNAWHPLPGSGPPLRIGQQFAFDARRRVVVVLGGNLPNQPPASEVWEYDLNTWTRVP